MCESPIKVVDFDKIPNEFARGKGWSGVPKSNDALYIDTQGMWHFMELAEEEEKLFEVDKLEGYLFKETHTYTQSLFEKNFVLVKEKEEGISS